MSITVFRWGGTWLLHTCHLRKNDTVHTFTSGIESVVPQSKLPRSEDAEYPHLPSSCLEPCTQSLFTSVLAAHFALGDGSHVYTRLLTMLIDGHAATLSIIDLRSCSFVTYTAEKHDEATCWWAEQVFSTMCPIPLACMYIYVTAVRLYCRWDLQWMHWTEVGPHSEQKQ